MSEYKFQSTVDPKKLAEVYEVSGEEWSGALSAEEYGKVEAKHLVKWILSGRPGRGFYLESKSGEVVASCIVTHHKGFYKEPERAGIDGAPDPLAFGVNNVTGLRVEHVFTRKAHRGKGLMRKLLLRAIEYTEDEIIKKELSKSSDKKDSLKLMVTTDGKVDRTLVNYYLGKKYFWYLYSAIGTGYSIFGFKGYPIDGYKIPVSLSSTETYKLVEKALLSESQQVEVGKKIRFLDGSKKLDKDLIDYILQGSELDLITDLNKGNFHGELSGGRRSSSSLTNIASALSTTRLGSTNELSAISEQLDKTLISNTKDELSKRRLSVLSFGVPRLGIKAEMPVFEKYYLEEEEIAQTFGSEENIKFSKVKGAILTNELQQKSFYILWTVIMGKKFVIVGMGELKLDLFGAIADPSGFTNPLGRRRGSSFTGINEMGGFNFQDMALLVNTAVYVATHRFGLDSGVYVTTNDLPQTIPTPVLHDFFMNFLPNEPGEVVVAGQEGATLENSVEYIKDFGKGHSVLPMLKKFGSESPEFDLDWTGICFAVWG